MNLAGDPRAMRWTGALAWLLLVGVVICLAGAYVVSVWIHQRPDIILFIKGLINSYGLIGVLVVTIIAGTVIPMGSPAIVASAAGFGMPMVPLIIVASIGYTIGVTINYYLARTVGIGYVEKRVSKETLEDLMRRWNKWGTPLLIGFGLVPGLPIDLLALVCGLLRMKIIYFLLISFSTRIVQYAACALLGITVGGLISI